MASTDFPVGHPLAVKLWSRVLLQEALYETYMRRFMGKGPNSLIQVKTETSKGAGDRIRCGLRMLLSGAGVQGDSTLEGNEEAMEFYYDDLFIDQLRHGVRSHGKMSEQRVPYNMRMEAKDALRDWWADRLDTWFFNQLGGISIQNDTRYTGNQAVSAADADHIYYGHDSSSPSEDASITTSAIFRLSIIDACVKKAKTLTPLMRPVRLPKYGSVWVMFIHPNQVEELRTSTDTGQWLDIQKAAMQGGDVTENPIFTGALGMYNNTILHESSRVPKGINVSASATVSAVRRAIFCGAQAGMIAFGSGSQGAALEWKEESFDYDNQLGVEAGMIAGLKKTRFNSKDFGTIVVPTYST